MAEHKEFEDVDVALLRGPIVESLYREAMALAEDARGYFEAIPIEDRVGLSSDDMVAMSCEWLKTTSRLMHVIAWLLSQRAYEAGELTARESEADDRALGDAKPADAEICSRLPDAARLLIVRSEQLYERVTRLQASLAHEEDEHPSPARALMRELASRV